MLNALTGILVCQLAGEALAAWLGLPVPGPVIGMALLFGFLLIRGAVPAALEKTAGGLLDNLALLFVPAGVGVMLHGALLREAGAPILLILLLSMSLAMIVTGWVMTFFSKGESDDAG